jgi:uncharacterized protein (DUF58 family)
MRPPLAGLADRLAARAAAIGAADRVLVRDRAGDHPGGRRREILFDEATLARLRKLTAQPGRVRVAGIVGEHRSRRRGASPEFADFKSYSQGDDFRLIDWNTYARLDGLFVRLSEVTTELDVHLLLDASDSMAWRGDPSRPTKFAHARRLAGALGYVALFHFDRVALTPFGSTLGRPFGPTQGRSQMLPLLTTLEAMDPLGGTALADTIDRYLHARRRPGLLVLLSDLLAGEPEGLRATLRDACARGWQVAVLHVLDPAERDPAAGGWAGDGDGGAPALELIDAESGERLELSPETGVLDRYRAAFADWQERLARVCAEERAIYAPVATDVPFDEVLLGLLRQRGVVG